MDSRIASSVSFVLAKLFYDGDAILSATNWCFFGWMLLISLRVSLRGAAEFCWLVGKGRRERDGERLSTVSVEDEDGRSELFLQQANVLSPAEEGEANVLSPTDGLPIDSVRTGDERRYFSACENATVLACLWTTQIALFFASPEQADGISVVWAGQAGQFLAALMWERGLLISSPRADGATRTQEEALLCIGVVGAGILGIFYALTLDALTTVAHVLGLLLGGLLMGVGIAARGRTDERGDFGHAKRGRMDENHVEDLERTYGWCG